MKNNKFAYEIEGGSVKGFFNIYQGRNGKIYMMMGNNVTALTYEQVCDLQINTYNLKDFSVDDFAEAYELTNV